MFCNPSPASPVASFHVSLFSSVVSFHPLYLSSVVKLVNNVHPELEEHDLKVDLDSLTLTFLTSSLTLTGTLASPESET